MDTTAAADAGRRFSLKRLSPVIGAALFLVALAVLHGELRDVRYHQLTGAVQTVARSRLLLALLLTALNYAVLTGYDQLAFAWIGRPLRRGWIALAGFVSYAISNSFGFGMLSGAAVRVRFYTRWGVSARELSQIVLFQTTTFWLGLLVLGGIEVGVTPHLWLRELPLAGLVRGLGIAMLALAAAYAVLPFVRHAPLSLRGFELPVPRPRLMAGQFVLSTLDWTLAAAVLYVLLPSGRVPFGALLGAFLAAQIAGLASHVPGGLGVFETLMVLALRPYLEATAVVSALVVYRFVYYVLPLALALALMLVEEAREGKARLISLGGVFGSVSAAIAPRLLAAFTFVAGALLLFSGATPAVRGRIDWLSAIVPLPLVEVGHFVGSLVGISLLLVSRGVWRRLDAAYYLAVLGLLTGIVASLLKGADWEEATVLALLLLAFAPSRRAFDRRAAFFEGRLAFGWLLAVLAVVVASVWLGFFAFKHVEYSHDLWWSFELQADAPRFLRASVGVMVGLFVFGVARLLRPAPPQLALPSPSDLEDAARVIATQPTTMPNLALMGDKALLFDDERSGFVMYAVAGRNWVALGDPVANGETARRDLVRRFLGRCDDYAGRPIFYQVGKDCLHLYADFGLTFVKLGEQARVELECFSLEGAARKPFRNSLRRAEREGVGFSVLQPEETTRRIDELAAVSDDWLSRRGVSEKGFSLGAFDPTYVSRFPAAVIEQQGKIVAFATMWPGAGARELSVDLMRHTETAPKYAMELLFTRLLLWGAEQGFAWFDLGVAPLSGIESSPLAPLWARIAHLVYQRGEAFYNFQGLRAFKEKFDPSWEPRYLAYPGGLSLPGVMADISALIAGGYGRIFR